jgi:CPA2 family monovalent cation:H+ antiporter-2
VATQRRLGRSFVYGDATNASVLESAGVGEASAVVLTMPDDNAVLRACLMVRRENPDVFLAARVSYLSKALAAKQHGADHVVTEEIATAEAMVGRVTDEVQRAREAREKAAGAGQPEGALDQASGQASDQVEGD